MVIEQYVNFETAKLLKKKGFNEGCSTTYTYNGLLHFYNYRPLGSDIFAPTQQMAMRWLREIHGLFIWISFSFPGTGLNYYYEIRNLKNGKVEHIGGIKAGSYEVACDSAINYCLEQLI